MRAVPVLVGLPVLFAPALAMAHHSPSWESPGSLVGVSIEVEGRSAPLYPAPDGSGRFYVEARLGARYAIRLDNRSHERLGVLLTVDGLNVISGERPKSWRWLPSDPGRMYVLEPWDSALVQGWRTSLDEVRRFTFVDEERSYATRSGKANAKMGWIEVAVYRQRHPIVRWPWQDKISGDRPAARGTREKDEGGEDTASRPPAAEAPSSSDPRSAAKAREEEKANGAGARRDSYPGTGWGSRTDDQAVVVEFQPERSPAERITLRYEYAKGLRALGIFPRPSWERDRLWQRDRGTDGFAQPPRW